MVVVKAVFKRWGWCWWCVIVSLLLLHIVLKIFMTRNACLQACCNRFDHDDYSRNFHQINNEVDLDYSGVFFFSLHKYTNTQTHTVIFCIVHPHMHTRINVSSKMSCSTINYSEFTGSFSRKTYLFTFSKTNKNHQYKKRTER